MEEFARTAGGHEQLDGGLAWRMLCAHSAKDRPRRFRVVVGAGDRFGEVTNKASRLLLSQLFQEPRECLRRVGPGWTELTARAREQRRFEG